MLHVQKLFPTEACVHDPPMRLFWKKASDEQLELLGVEPVPPVPPRTEPRARNNQDCGGNASVATAQPAAVLANGHPRLVPLDRLYEDPNNPRTEFPKSQIDELADDIRERGILEPIVFHPADESEITRAAVAAVRAKDVLVAAGGHSKRRATSLLAQANSACARLELALARIKPVESDLVEADLATLRQRIASLTGRLT